MHGKKVSDVGNDKGDVGGRSGDIPGCNVDDKEVQRLAKLLGFTWPLCFFLLGNLIGSIFFMVFSNFIYSKNLS